MGITLDGHLYAFTNRHRNKIKCLFWEDNGFVLYYKSLADDKFHWPKPDIIPARVQVKEILQEKAVFLEKAEPGEESQEKCVFKAGQLPKHPIPKFAVTVRMLAWIIIAKYGDALTL